MNTQNLKAQLLIGKRFLILILTNFLGKRKDNRSFKKIRNNLIQRDLLQNADGSNRLQIGKTLIYSSISFSIEKFNENIDLQQLINIDFKLHETNSTKFQYISLDEKERTLKSQLTKLLLVKIENKSIFEKNELIVPSIANITLGISIDVVQDDGNLLSACLLSLFGSFLALKLPETLTKGKTSYYYLNFLDKTNMIYGSDDFRYLSLNFFPFGFNFGFIEKSVIFDLTAEEETDKDIIICDIICYYDLKKKIILQKGIEKKNNGFLSVEKIRKIISEEIFEKRIKEIEDSFELK